MRMALLLGAALATACNPPSDDIAEEYTNPSNDPNVAVTDGPLQFEVALDSLGLRFEHETGAFGEKWMPETMGGGVALLDYDGDGWTDVLLTSGTEWPGHGGGTSGLRLFRNREGRAFDDVTERAGLNVAFYGMGLAIADYDADGDDDIYVTAVGDNRLFRNDRGRFTDATLPMRVHGNDPSGLTPPAWSTGAAWADVDRDGWLDLFVCNYVRWTPETDLFTTLDGSAKSYATPQQYHGESCRLYRNRQARGFDDVSLSAGVDNPEGKSLGIALEDVNDDGWIDIVVANDTYRNFLYVNNGDGTFTDAALPAGIALDEFGRARAGMGVDVADVFGDGRLSIAIGNFSREALSLYTLVAPMAFQDLAGRARLNRPTSLPLTFGVAFADLDLDGDLDLIAANGHIEPEISAVQQDITFHQPPQLFQNDGAGHFVEMADVQGFTPMVGRGVAVGDLDGDGDLDFVIASNGGQPKVWANTAGGSSVRLTLRGEYPNLDAMGAVVTGYVNGRQMRWMVRTGSSYLSQSDSRGITLGLGKDSSFDSVTVRWPTTARTVNLGRVRMGRYVLHEATDSLAIDTGAGR